MVREGVTSLQTSPFGKGRCRAWRDGGDKKVMDKTGRVASSAIYRAKKGRTIPQSAFGCQIPLHKGAIIEMPPLMVKGRCHEVTEGIRKPGKEEAGLRRTHFFCWKTGRNKKSPRPRGRRTGTKEGMSRGCPLRDDPDKVVRGAKNSARGGAKSALLPFRIYIIA